VWGDGGEAAARAVADELGGRLDAFCCERICGLEDLVAGDTGAVEVAELKQERGCSQNVFLDAHSRVC
jgi:hypothetical protein